MGLLTVKNETTHPCAKRQTEQEEGSADGEGDGHSTTSQFWEAVDHRRDDRLDCSELDSGLREINALKHGRPHTDSCSI